MSSTIIIINNRREQEKRAKMIVTHGEKRILIMEDDKQRSIHEILDERWTNKESTIVASSPIYQERITE